MLVSWRVFVFPRFWRGKVGVKTLTPPPQVEPSVYQVVSVPDSLDPRELWEEVFLKSIFFGGFCLILNVSPLFVFENHLNSVLINQFFE